MSESQCKKCEGLKNALIFVFTKEVQKECTALCSKKVPSSLRQTSKESMLEFSLSKFEKELEEKAPLLRAILKAASLPRLKDANESKWLLAATMAAAVLLKNRSPYMTAVQLLITVIIQHLGLMVRMNLCQYLYIQ